MKDTPIAPIDDNDLGNLVAYADALEQAGEFGQAEQAYRRILEHVAPVHYCIGSLAARRNDVKVALLFLAAAANLAPDNPTFQLSYGHACFRAGDSRRARACAEHALSLEPDSARAHDLLGALNLNSARLADAIASYREATRLDPDARAAPHAWAHLGLVLLLDGQLLAARDALESAVRFRSDDVPSWSNLVTSLHLLGWREDADTALARAATALPQYDDVAASQLLFANADPDTHVAELAAAHRAWGARAMVALPQREGALQPRQRRERLRVGYVSADFRGHPVASFFEPILRNHDARAIESFCYYSNVVEDETTERLRRTATGGWRSVGTLPDAAFESLVRADEIDILVDLSGHTSGNRLSVFARRPAAVQVSYLGYPNTTGLPVMDYYISDTLSTPHGSADDVFAEKLVRIDPVFCCFEPPATAPSVAPPPLLRTGAPTFGAFGQAWKISRVTLALWCAVLRRLPTARLYVKNLALRAPEVRKRLLGRFRGHDIDPDRVTLDGFVPTLEEHLAKYAAVDVILDSFPYGGTTATCEALWMGVPVVTLAGESRASRVGLSLLSAGGRPELATSSEDAFVETAVTLASDLDRLVAMRSSLRDGVRASPLCDHIAFTRALEAAYRSM